MLFRKTTNFLYIVPLLHEGCGFMCYLPERSKRFLSLTTRHVKSRSSRCNSIGEALQVGERNVATRPPVPEISEITDTYTDTHTHTTHTENTGINVIDTCVFLRLQWKSENVFPSTLADYIWYCNSIMFTKLFSCYKYDQLDVIYFCFIFFHST